MNYPSRKSAAGFTLMELLVAMLIFAIMSVLAYGGLRTVISTSEGIERKIASLEELQRGMHFIERDVRQMLERPVNSDSGDKKPALSIDSNGDGFMEFTRGGNLVPAGLPGSSTLLRIRYSLDEEGNLGRTVWRQADYVDSVEVVPTVLLRDVTSVKVRALEQGKWVDSWGSTPAQLSLIPQAIEVTIEHKGFDEIKRLFLIR